MTRRTCRGRRARRLRPGAPRTCRSGRRGMRRTALCRRRSDASERGMTSPAARRRARGWRTPTAVPPAGSPTTSTAGAVASAPARPGVPRRRARSASRRTVDRDACWRRSDGCACPRSTLARDVDRRGRSPGSAGRDGTTVRAARGRPWIARPRRRCRRVADHVRSTAGAEVSPRRRRSRPLREEAAGSGASTAAACGRCRADARRSGCRSSCRVARSARRSSPGDGRARSARRRVGSRPRGASR